MLLSLAVTISSLAPPDRSEARAQATIRIQRPGTANDKSWEQAPKSSRREIIVRDESGHPLRLRLLDYQ
ncbi:MAG: hypothetical protein ACJ8FN_02245 [Sphingomicrobium sp.]